MVAVPLVQAPCAVTVVEMGLGAVIVTELPVLLTPTLGISVLKPTWLAAGHWSLVSATLHTWSEGELKLPGLNEALPVDPQSITSVSVWFKALTQD